MIRLLWASRRRRQQRVIVDADGKMMRTNAQTNSEVFTDAAQHGLKLPLKEFRDAD
jgi:hypothetical protein